MNIFEAIIQGIVQGLTEFLPVSSSGHLAISQHILGVGQGNLFFNVMLHIGTLIAVVIVYRKLIVKLFFAFIKLVKKIIQRNFKWNEMTQDENMVVMLFIGLLPLFFLFIPLPFGQGLTPKYLAEMWSGYSGYLVIVGVSLVITSILLMLGGTANKITEKTYKLRGVVRQNGAGRHRINAIDALSVGVAQMLAAVFPGLSRSGTTLAVGELRGLNKQMALDYAFVLGIPSILAAALIEGKEAISTGTVTSDMILPIIFGVITSAVVGLFAILLFKWMLKSEKMHLFAIYTAIVGAIIIIIGCIELITGANVFTGEPLVFM